MRIFPFQAGLYARQHFLAAAHIKYFSSLSFQTRQQMLMQVVAGDLTDLYPAVAAKRQTDTFAVGQQQVARLQRPTVFFVVQRGDERVGVEAGDHLGMLRTFAQVKRRKVSGKLVIEELLLHKQGRRDGEGAKPRLGQSHENAEIIAEFTIFNWKIDVF